MKPGNHSGIIPCYCVTGSDGNLTGYKGGPERKESLLQMEKAVMEEL